MASLAAKRRRVALGHPAIFKGYRVPELGNMIRRTVITFAAVSAAALLAGCGDKGAADAPSTDAGSVFTNFTLVDGSGRPAQPGSAMIVGADGKIAWVGPAAEAKAPAGARTVDLGGKFVTPGLIDLHVHLGNVVDLNQDKANFTRGNVEKDLRTYAAYGVTTVLSMGTDGDLIFPLRQEQRQSGRPEMTRVYTAGQGVVFKGGYGGVPGVNQPVATPEEAVALVNAQADKGVDIVKLWLDDELGQMPKMPPAISQAVIDTAHKRGLRVLAHIFYLEDAKRLVNQGVDGLVHSVRDKPVDAELIAAMKQKGVWQVAETLSREASMFAYGVPPSSILQDPFFAAGVSPGALDQLRSPDRQKKIASAQHFHDYPRFLDMAEANLKRLKDGGVAYGFGTDSGPPGRFGGYFAHWELELMAKAGVSPLEAIHSATGKAAEFLRTTDIGVLEPGRYADLVVVDADPTADILNLRKINAVYIAGRSVPPIRP